MDVWKGCTISMEMIHAKEVLVAVAFVTSDIMIGIEAVIIIPLLCPTQVHLVG